MSNEITRFNHVTDWGMERDVDGDYVLHSDHEAEVARLRAELNAATKAGLDAIAMICEKEREADALRVDAERYRVLRSSYLQCWEDGQTEEPTTANFCFECKGWDMDAALDREISAMGEGK